MEVAVAAQKSLDIKLKKNNVFAFYSFFKSRGLHSRAWPFWPIGSYFFKMGIFMKIGEFFKKMTNYGYWGPWSFWDSPKKRTFFIGNKIVNIFFRSTSFLFLINIIFIFQKSSILKPEKTVLMAHFGQNSIPKNFYLKLFLLRCVFLAALSHKLNVIFHISTFSIWEFSNPTDTSAKNVTLCGGFT